MNKYSAKTKIYFALGLWLLLCASMLFYFFGILDLNNQKAVLAMSTQQQELKSWQDERDSYQQAQSDLKKIAQEPYQPADLFDQDVTLVKEIETLESWATQLGLQLNLSGISGTVGSEPKAPTKTALATVPYSINLQGPFSQVVAYVEALEHMRFVTTVGSINLSAATANTVNANLTANFYIHASQ